MNFCLNRIVRIISLVVIKMVSKENNDKRVTIVIDKNLDYKFRKMASQKFKFEPKWYSKAIEEAVNLWIDNNVGEDFE